MFAKASLYATTTVFAAMALTPAQAQIASKTADASPSSVTEIVVTAQKREQKLQSVAGAVSAISRQQIQQTGVTNITDLQFHVPSLVAGTANAITAVSIRGVGLNSLSEVAQPGVAIHVDGVYQARVQGSGLGEIDLDRIEVLRGPQGTLYGRNATGGAVNFITAAPTDKFEGSVLAGYASYNEYHLNGMLNVPINDRIRTRAVVDYDSRQDGFEKNVIPDGPNADKGSVLSGRFKIDADLTDRFKVDLAVFGQTRQGGFPYIQLTTAPDAAAVKTAPQLAGAIVPLTPHEYSSNTAPKENLNTYGTALTADYDFGWSKLRSITAYSRFFFNDVLDADGTNIDFSPQTTRESADTVSQEFDLSGKFSRLNWLVGGFYMDDQLSDYDHFDFPTGYPGSSLRPGGSLELDELPYATESKALFTDDTLNITNRLRLIAGVRYSEDTVTNRELITITGIQVAGHALPPTISCNASAEIDFHSVTPRGGLQFDIDKDIGSYFTVSQGFKDGGINGSACNQTFKPETITSYEGGLRMQFFNRRLTFNPTLFYYDYNNFQLNQFVGLSKQVVNAPTATVKGFEAEANWQANEHVSLYSTLTLLDAKYGAGFFNTDVINPQLGLQSLDGKTLNRSPKASGTIGIAYRTSMTPYGRFTFRADEYVSSRVYFREFNLPQDSQPAYQVLNLNLIWDSNDGKYTARFYVDNATNSNVVAAMDASSTFGARFETWQPPLQLGGEIKVRF